MDTNLEFTVPDNLESSTEASSARKQEIMSAQKEKHSESKKVYLRETKNAAKAGGKPECLMRFQCLPRLTPSSFAFAPVKA